MPHTVSPDQLAANRANAAAVPSGPNRPHHPRRQASFFPKCPQNGFTATSPCGKNCETKPIPPKPKQTKPLAHLAKRTHFPPPSPDPPTPGPRPLVPHPHPAPIGDNEA